MISLMESDLNATIETKYLKKCPVTSVSQELEDSVVAWGTLKYIIYT